jgi:hypothetical protein
MLRYDFIDISKAAKTPEGWIKDNPILTRSGIFEYRRADGTVQREYRPPEEVFSDEHLNSLRGLPVTDGHPGRVNEDNDDAIVGAVLTEGKREDSNLRAEIVIHRTKKIGARRELSLGYSLELDETPGEIDGQRYDAIQRNLRGNHLAVVTRGRAGNARLRLDREDAAEASVKIEDQSIMAEPSNLPRLVTVRVDRLDYQAQPEVAAALDRVNEALTAEKAAREADKLRADSAIADATKAGTDAAKAEKARADALEAERDALKADVAKHEAAIAKAREDAVADVRARLELESVAKAHGVDAKPDMTPRAIREAVTNKLAPDVYKFDGKEDAYVAFAFDAETAKVKKATETNDRNRIAANGGGQEGNPAPRQDSAQVIRSSADLRRALARV